MTHLYRFVDRVPPVYSLLIWIALWEIVGQLDLAFILPPFSAVIEQLFFLVQRPLFQAAAIQTFAAFCIDWAPRWRPSKNSGFIS